MREALTAALLLVAAGLIVIGVAYWSAGAAWVTGGVLLAAWALAAVRDVEADELPE